MHTKRIVSGMLGVLVIAGCSRNVADSGPDAVVKEEEAGLMAQATVTSDSAIAIAKARVPGRIVEAELEREGTALVYSFDIKVVGDDELTEVDVDANTGAILKVSGDSVAVPGAIPTADTVADATVKEKETGLMAQATITSDSAIAIAKARVPGRIVEADLEREGNVLVYSFEIKVAGKDALTEVDVDARTGAIIKVTGDK
jgi:uncharacterized membrane protein YkoI